MQGGIPEGHIVLVRGSAGTMKSSVCFNILYNECLAGKSGLYLSLEQSAPSLLKHMVNLDFDLSKVNIVQITDINNLSSQISQKKDSGSLILCDLGAIRKQVQYADVG